MRFIFLSYDIHTQFNAFIADKDSRSSNQFSNLMLAFTAERTIESIF
jgi:hypothetical protein